MTQTTHLGGLPTPLGTKRLHFGGDRGARERKLFSTLKTPESARLWDWLMLSLFSLCHALKNVLGILSQPEGETKGTHHQKITTGPEPYTGTWIQSGLWADKEETVCCRAGMARKGAQGPKGDGNKGLSLPTSLGRVRRNWGVVSGKPPGPLQLRARCGM